MDLLIRAERVGPPKGAAYQRPRPCRPLLEGISGRPNSTSDIPRGFEQILDER